MKIVIELDDSISLFDANDMVDSLNNEPYVKNAYIENGCCGGCNHESKTEDGRIITVRYSERRGCLGAIDDEDISIIDNDL